MLIDRSITQTINLNNNRFNHKHGHVSFCKQLAFGKFFTVIYWLDKDIPVIGIIASYGYIRYSSFIVHLCFMGQRPYYLYK